MNDNNNNDQPSLTPEEHYIQAGEMLREVEGKIHGLLVTDSQMQNKQMADGYYNLSLWVESMTDAAAVHAQLAGIYTPTPLHLIPGTSVPAFDTYNDDDAEDDRP